MITICHLSSSRSERIVWLLEELGLEYRLDWFQREPRSSTGKYDLSPYANIRAYLERIESRPAYRKAMALAGPDARREGLPAAPEGR